MAKKDKGLLFFYDWANAFEALSGDECKTLLLAMLAYSQDGTAPPEFEGGAKVAASFLFPAISRAKELSKAGSIAGRASSEKRTVLQQPFNDRSTVDQQQNNTKQKQNKTETGEGASPPAPSPPKKEKRFSPPTVEEVRAYCQERLSTVDAEQFVNHYTSNGWMVGKSPMKDWQAAVRNWEGRDRENGKRAVPAENDPNEVKMPF